MWGDAALFVPPDDDEELAAALRLLALDDALRDELARRARRRAWRYTPRHMAWRYLEVYERVTAAEVDAESVAS